MNDPIAIEKDIWSRLAAAAEDPKHPWHWPAIANVSLDGAPAVRTIVLREVDATARTLVFFTDLRSPKVAMIRRDPRVEFCFNDGPANTQLRVSASAEVLIDGDEVDERWRTVPPPTRAAYAQPTPSGTPIAQWQPKPQVTGEAGRENFAVVRCVVTSIDWLKLDPAGHFRIRFTYAGAAMTWTWLAP
jgi:pyridoxamine 5'-phosphate oxidase